MTTKTVNELNSAVNPRSIQPRTFLIVSTYGRPLNLPTIQMFQLPSVVTISIAATRMHRSLTDFASKAADVYDAFPFSPPLPTVVDNLQTVRAKLQSYSGYKHRSTVFK